MDGQHLELRGWEGNTLTLEQAKQAGRAAARKNIAREEREYDQLPLDDAYDALRLYVTLEGAEGMEKGSLLGDVFCDAYDDEIELQARRFER